MKNYKKNNSLCSSAVVKSFRPEGLKNNDNNYCNKYNSDSDSEEIEESSIRGQRTSRQPKKSKNLLKQEKVKLAEPINGMSSSRIISSYINENEYEMFKSNGGYNYNPNNNEISSSIKNPFKKMQNEDDDYNNLNNNSYLKFNINNSVNMKNININDTVNIIKDTPINDIEDEEEKNSDILNEDYSLIVNNAATIIQRNYKGFIFRKKLLEELLSFQEMVTNNNQMQNVIYDNPKEKINNEQENKKKNKNVYVNKKKTKNENISLANDGQNYLEYKIKLLMLKNIIKTKSMKESLIMMKYFKKYALIIKKLKINLLCKFLRYKDKEKAKMIIKKYTCKKELNNVNNILFQANKDVIKIYFNEWKNKI